MCWKKKKGASCSNGLGNWSLNLQMISEGETIHMTITSSWERCLWGAQAPLQGELRDSEVAPSPAGFVEEGLWGCSPLWVEVVPQKAPSGPSEIPKWRSSSSQSAVIFREVMPPGCSVGFPSLGRDRRWLLFLAWASSSQNGFSGQKSERHKSTCSRTG